MGFYYGSNQPPPDDDEPGGFKDLVAIIFAVFAALALPLAFIFGMIFYIVALFWLFTVHWIAGLAWLAIAVAAVAARGVWEAKHPPELK